MPIKLSLICPVYKVAEFIPDLMQSLYSGINNEQVEVVFVDDCSPDNSINLVTDFLNKFKSNILFEYKILSLKKNKGLSGARNEGLKIASGDYIGYIDSDDVISSKYWDTLSPYIKTAKKDIIEFGYKEFSSTLPDDLVEPVHELAVNNLSPFTNGFFVWTRVYKKELLGKIVFPEGMIYEDVHYNTHTFSLAKSLIKLSPVLVFYRQRQGSIVSKRTSTYANLMFNLVHATIDTIDRFDDKSALVREVAKYSFLNSLKGLKITSTSEKIKFFVQLKKTNAVFYPVFKKYNSSIVGWFYLKAANMACRFGQLKY